MSIGVIPDHSAICIFCKMLDDKDNMLHAAALGWFHDWNCDGRTPQERLIALMKEEGIAVPKSTPVTSDLQALLTGVIYGSLLQADMLKIDIEQKVDDDGNILPEIEVLGQASGERVRIRVEVI